MEPSGPRLPSLATMPRFHYNSAEASDSTNIVEPARELAGRAVYPVTLKLMGDRRVLDLQQHSVFVSVQLQHDEVGTDSLWVDSLTPCHTEGATSVAATTCVWIGDGVLATVADACLTISLKRTLNPAVPEAATSSQGVRHRRSSWRCWLPCQLVEAGEPEETEQILEIQDSSQVEELLQETILLQEVLLTAHMAKGYDVPLTSEGSARLEVVIGTPQKGPYHLALRHANPGTLFSDHNGDDVFAVLPLPPRGRKSFTGSHPPLPPKHPGPAQRAVASRPSKTSLISSPPNAQPQGNRQQPQGSTAGPQGRRSAFAKSKSFSSVRPQGRWSTNSPGVQPKPSSIVESDGAHRSAPRQSMSKKQLQFAPLHEDPAVARPTTRDTNATLLSSRSRSVGFDRATVQGLLQDAGVADTGSRPASAILFGKVSVAADEQAAVLRQHPEHLKEVTVAADEQAALQLVSQGSIQSTSRRISRSREQPDGLDRRRSHNRASTATAKDMQTGTPSLDFQIMLLAGDNKTGTLARCVQEAPGLCISIKDALGEWTAWAQLTYPSDRQGPLELQDIKVAFVPSAQTLSSDAVASGSFQLTAAGSFPPAAEAHPTTQAASGAQQANRLAHQWLWQPEVSQVLAGIHHNAGLPIISKSVSVHAHAGRVDNAVQSKAQHQTHQLKGQESSAVSRLPEPPSAVLESGLVQTACIAVRHIDAAAILQSTHMVPRNTGSRRESRSCSRQVSFGANDPPAKRSFDSAGWTQVRRGVDIESEAGQRRVSDGSSVSGTRFREPCPVALWFTDPSTEQAAAMACLSYALYALTYAVAASAAAAKQ